MLDEAGKVFSDRPRTEVMTGTVLISDKSVNGYMEMVCDADDLI